MGPWVAAMLASRSGAYVQGWLPGSGMLRWPKLGKPACVGRVSAVVVLGRGVGSGVLSVGWGL